MKKSKIMLLVVLALGIVLLAGCGRSDVTLTVNKDGSFTANVDYGIAKALMGNEEVQEQVKALITDSLDENDIPYTESENDDYVTISVEREFESIDELTDANAWQGISFVPKFSSEQSQDELWTRYEDGKLKISGTLSSGSFGADDLVSQSGSVSSFGGSLTVVLPDEAESYGEAEAVGTSYKWSGNADETRNVELVSAQMSAAASSADGITTTKSDVIGIVVFAIAVVAAVVVVIVLKKKKKNSMDE